MHRIHTRSRREYLTIEISRFMDEYVHRSAYVVCLGQCG